MIQWVGEINSFRVLIHAKMRTVPCQMERVFKGLVDQADIVDSNLLSFVFLDFLTIYEAVLISQGLKQLVVRNVLLSALEDTISSVNFTQNI